MGLFREIKVTSLGELVDRAMPKEPDPASGRRRTYAVFRGVADTNWSLLTSLDRLGGCHPPHTKGHLEEHILRNFIRYARPFLQNSHVNDWELLITAQHHGLPTRLLDWSHSPLIAAHFATLTGEPQTDRVVWRLDWKNIHDHFDLKPLAFLVSDLDEALAQKGYKSISDLFDSEPKQDQLFICMVEPPALDARILAQSAAFTLCSTKNRGFDDVLRQCQLTDCLTKFVIPAQHVESIRDQLDLCSMDERRLFPDLDGIAAELTRYYAATGS